MAISNVGKDHTERNETIGHTRGWRGGVELADICM
jgi:hypothetical protein